MQLIITMHEREKKEETKSEDTSMVDKQNTLENLSERMTEKPKSIFQWSTLLILLLVFLIIYTLVLLARA